VRGVLCDVRDYDAVERAAHMTVEAFGKVHVVCNNTRGRSSTISSRNIPIPPLENGEFTMVVRTGCGQIQVGDQAICDRAQSDPPKAQVIENLAMYQLLLQLTLCGAVLMSGSSSSALNSMERELQIVLQRHVRSTNRW
jgi:NAD(P)-dependent dehydrogenase (short-subunit alcohol dehydrogenase family)